VTATASEGCMTSDLDLPSGIHPVTAESFDSAVLARSRELPVLVDFSATWCAPCQAMAIVLEGLAREFAGRALVATIDTDASPELAARFGVRGLPTLMLFRDGEAVDGLVGGQSEATIRTLLATYLPSLSDRERTAALELARNGETDAAVTALEHLVASEPLRPAHALALIEVLTGAGRFAAARRTLERLPMRVAEDPLVAQSTARLELTEAAVLRAESGTPGALLTRAAADFLAGRHEAALTQLLDLLGRHPGDGDGGARRALRAAFTLLGSEHALVSAARRRMATLLH